MDLEKDFGITEGSDSHVRLIVITQTRPYRYCQNYSRLIGRFTPNSGRSADRIVNDRKPKRTFSIAAQQHDEDNKIVINGRDWTFEKVARYRIFC